MDEGVGVGGSHCQSVFMHVNFTSGSEAVDICDPWQYLDCSSTENQIIQGRAVVACMEVGAHTLSHSPRLR